jgi:hypothetical protein
MARGPRMHFQDICNSRQFRIPPDRRKWLHTVFTTEFVDPTGRVNDLLFTRIEGMTGGTNFDMQSILKGRTSFKLIATTASDLYCLIFRMDFSFHFSLNLLALLAN